MKTRLAGQINVVILVQEGKTVSGILVPRSESDGLIYGIDVALVHRSCFASLCCDGFLTLKDDWGDTCFLGSVEIRETMSGDRCLYHVFSRSYLRESRCQTVVAIEGSLTQC